MCWRVGGSCAPAARSWRASWRRPATPTWWRRRRSGRGAHNRRNTPRPLEGGGRGRGWRQGGTDSTCGANPSPRPPPSRGGGVLFLRGRTMNAPVTGGVQGFLSRFEGLRTRLPGDPAPRLAAAETLRTVGLPGRRDEAWHYTNLRPIAEVAFCEPLTPLVDCAALLARMPNIGTRLVFIDGRFRADLSGMPTNATFEPFAVR